VAQEADHLPHKWEAPSSNFSTAKNNLKNKTPKSKPFLGHGISQSKSLVLTGKRNYPKSNEVKFMKTNVYMFLTR
jgi:hypothetical protein